MPTYTFNINSDKNHGYAGDTKNKSGDSSIPGFRGKATLGRNKEETFDSSGKMRPEEANRHMAHSKMLKNTADSKTKKKRSAAQQAALKKMLNANKGN